MSFAIYDVPGFRTIYVPGASQEKRMRSAVNEMSRDIRKMMSEMDECFNLGKSPPFSIERSETIRKAAQILKSVREPITPESNSLARRLRPVTDVRTMSTSEFFDTSDRVYQGNTELLLNSVELLEKGREKLAEESSATAASEETTVAIGLDLYRCYGGSFGDTEILLPFTKESIANLGEGDPVTAVRALCYEHLCGLKNFRLSDYLRSDNKENKTIVRADIVLLDQQLASVLSVEVEFVMGLLSNASLDKSAHAKLDSSVLRSLNVIQKESVMRLIEHFGKIETKRINGKIVRVLNPTIV
jgi:hypothetical protein